MKLKETIEGFLETISERSKDVYRGKITYFYGFLTDVKYITDQSFQSYLASMRDDEVIESLEVYINNSQVNKVSVALHYISVVRRYFNYIYTLGVQNNNLLKQFTLEDKNVQSFNYKLNTFIADNAQLASMDVKEPLTFEEVKGLIAECDEEIDEILKYSQITLDNIIPTNKYSTLMAAIIMKLIAFTGIKFNIVNKIFKDDFDIEHNTLCINNFTIHLPDNLADQMKRFLLYREKINSEIDLLFVKSNGKALNREAATLCKMEDYIGRRDTTGLTKYGVVEMIKKGVNQSILQEFTGVGDDIFKDCQRRVNGEKNVYASRYLDSKLRSLPINDII